MRRLARASAGIQTVRATATRLTKAGKDSIPTPGVLGSELAGAGLGGCVLALVEADRAEAVLDTLAREFYAPLGASPAAFVCAPAHGAAVFW